jgi:hypothetical protein
VAREGAVVRRGVHSTPHTGDRTELWPTHLKTTADCRRYSETDCNKPLFGNSPVEETNAIGFLLFPFQWEQKYKYFPEVVVLIISCNRHS